MFQIHSYQLKRYYDQALYQRGVIFAAGIVCLAAGFGIILVALNIIRTVPSADNTYKIVIGILGAVGGILGNFIGVIFLRMFTETLKSIGNFHDRLVATHHLHFADFLISKISGQADRDGALRVIAERATLQDPHLNASDNVPKKVSAPDPEGTKKS